MNQFTSSYWLKICQSSSCNVRSLIISSLFEVHLLGKLFCKANFNMCFNTKLTARLDILAQFVDAQEPRNYCWTVHHFYVVMFRHVCSFHGFETAIINVNSLIQRQGISSSHKAFWILLKFLLDCSIIECASKLLPCLLRLLSWPNMISL